MELDGKAEQEEGTEWFGKQAGKESDGTSHGEVVAMVVGWG